MGTVLFMHKPFILIRKHSLFRPVAAAGSILLFVLVVFNPPNWFYVLSAIVLLLMLYCLWRQNKGIPIIFHTDGQIFVGKKPYSLTLGEFKGVASAFCSCGQTNFCLRIALIPKNVCHPVLIVQEISDSSARARPPAARWMPHMRLFRRHPATSLMTCSGNPHRQSFPQARNYIKIPCTF